MVLRVLPGRKEFPVTLVRLVRLVRLVLKVFRVLLVLTGLTVQLVLRVFRAILAQLVQLAQLVRRVRRVLTAVKEFRVNRGLMVLRVLKVQPVLTVRKESKVRLGRPEPLGLLVQLALKVRPEPLGLLAVKEFRVSRVQRVLLGQLELPGRWEVPALLVLMVKGASKVFEDFKVLMVLMGPMGLTEQVQLVAGRILRCNRATTIVHRLRLLLA
jgi:hypothetical protein